MIFRTQHDDGSDVPNVPPFLGAASAAPRRFPAKCAAARTGSAEASRATPLVRAGLLHVQFETIHPFLDGNGRIGRLLVTLLLEHWMLLTTLLYLSLFFKRHREEYYRRLNAVRVDGDWEGWIDFFLDGVATIADEAVASARELFALVEADRTRVLAHEGMSVVALRLFEQLRWWKETSWNCELL